MSSESQTQIEKLATYIPGFDLVADGGLPKRRTTLVSGTAGSAKTVFGVQFLAEGITKAQEAGVFVTFEELPQDIRQNMASFGWDISHWEKMGQWAFVDASPEPSDEIVVAGKYDLGALLARVEYAIRRTGAKRVALDSLGAVFTRFTDSGIIRQELFRVTSALKRMDVTAILTVERTDEYGEIGRYEIEEFVTDNVIILRNVLEEEKRRRTIEILKFRGTSHQKGEFPFTISPTQGIIVMPLSAIELTQKSTNIRISSGVPGLDQMCSSGFFRDSIILVSGATGTGKTLMSTQFLAAGATSGERSLLFAFEESREQLFRNATGWGIDFERMEGEGKLKVVCEYPEAASLEDHLIRMKSVIDAFGPQRLAVDSLSALERVSSLRSFREFVISLTSFIKDHETAGLFTATTPTLVGGTSITEHHISTITDSIILLRYVELYGEMHRGVTVLKMRGSMHDKDIRQFTIDHQGMHIGEPFRNVTGILVGQPTHVTPSEVDRLSGLFRAG
jgi:circadian clock protein KaiC